MLIAVPVPQIPNCDVLLAGPRVRDIIMKIVDGSPDSAKKIEEGDLVVDETRESGGCGIMRAKRGPATAGSGLAVCADKGGECSVRC